MNAKITLDLDVFREGAAAIGRMNGHVKEEDFAKVEECIDQLDKLALTPEQYIALPADIRCHTRAGARKSCRGKTKYNQDVPVFHLIREIVGNKEKIKSDMKRREIAEQFFRGVGNID